MSRWAAAPYLRSCSRTHPCLNDVPHTRYACCPARGHGCRGIIPRGGFRGGLGSLPTTRIWPARATKRRGANPPTVQPYMRPCDQHDQREHPPPFSHSHHSRGCYIYTELPQLEFVGLPHGSMRLYELEHERVTRLHGVCRFGVS